MKRKALIFFIILVCILLLVSACGGRGTDEGAENQISGAGTEVQSGPEETDEPETKAEENGATGIEENKAAGINSPDRGDRDAGQQIQSSGSGKAKQENRETIPDSGVAKENSGNGSENSSDPVLTPVKSEKNNESKDEVELWVTGDFGTKMVFDQKVPLEKDWSVFDVLQSSVDITTSYGGSYIESINGLKSAAGGFGGNKQDWFYYVNGVFCDTGALDYYPRPGDVVWWDYHRWENMATFPAVIGCYPRPFVGGFRGQTNPTIIMSSGGHMDLAGKLQKALQARGVTSVSVKELDPGLMEDRQNPVIVLGEWSQLSKVEWLNSFNKAYTKNGICVHFTAGKVGLLDGNRQVARTVGGDVGVITATGTGSGDPNPLWLVVGNSPEGLDRAVDVLVDNPGQIRGMYGAAILEGEVIRLPLQ